MYLHPAWKWSTASLGPFSWLGPDWLTVWCPDCAAGFAAGVPPLIGHSSPKMLNLNLVMRKQLDKSKVGNSQNNWSSFLKKKSQSCKKEKNGDCARLKKRNEATWDSRRQHRHEMLCTHRVGAEDKRGKKSVCRVRYRVKFKMMV